MQRVSIFILSILLFSGCGFDKKDLNDIKLLDENEKVVYPEKEQGDFDLKDYLFPDKNQINIYKVVKYRDNGGDRRYNENNPFMLNENEAVEYIVSENIIKEGSNTEYTVKDFSIQRKELVDEFYDIRDYRRFVDINDTYYSYEHVDNATTLYQVGYLLCKVMGHSDSKKILEKEYSDVLELMCKSESAQGVRGEFREKKLFSVTYYFAKGIGEIGAIGEECNIRDYDTIYKSCIKSKKELKDIK